MGNGHEDQGRDDIRLSAEDELAFDALIGAGFDPAGVDPSMRARAERIAATLGMLDCDPSDSADSRERLADRVVGAVRLVQQNSETLSREDGEALEAFVMSGYDASRAPSGLRPLAGAHEMVHGLIVGMGDENQRWIASGRNVRTEAVMDALTEMSASSMVFERPSRRRSFRIADLLTAAAAVLLMSAITLPVLNSMSESGRRQVCTANLQAAGMGIGMYAISNNDSLPMATAGFGGGWSQVGRPGKSHSANLFTLVRSRYVQPWELTCPGNKHAPAEPMDQDALDWGSLEEVSYSYRLMPGGQNRADLLNSDSVVLADRSPILLAGIRGHRISPEASSPNHGQEGQHLLRLDDSVGWTDTPVLENGDNIWLPRSIEQHIQNVRKKYGYFDGSELPTTPEDTFLGP